jgi:hypothetical protein
MTILLGAGGSYIQFVELKPNRICTMLLGEETARDFFVMYERGERIEVPMRYLVEQAIARETVREFVKQNTGHPKTRIWEMWTY